MTEVALTTNTALTKSEADELAHHEANIKHVMRAAFFEVGKDLAAIRDKRLYRGQYQTFEDYCRERWDIAASRARQLIAATETVALLESVTTVTPTNERQVRPLISLPPEQQREVWVKAVESVPKGEIPTGSVVEKIAQEVKGDEPDRPAYSSGWGTRRPATREALDALNSVLHYADPKASCKDNGEDGPRVGTSPNDEGT